LSQYQNKKDVLVLDDDIDIVSFMRILLQKIRLHVFAFTDPFLALEHFGLNSKSYGLVISDVRMPGMPGFEFIIKVREIQPSVKVLLMSAFEVSDIEFSRALPSNIKIDGFIQKPISSKELVKVVKNMLSI
jgi:response regulator RpfG family c-di-GMP phosphodiesterase